MKQLVRQKAKLLVTKLKAGRDSAETHLWIVPKAYPTFDKERPGLRLLLKEPLT